MSGYVEGVGMNGNAYTYYDSCEAGDLEGYVKEWICSGTMPTYRRFRCAHGCSGGACAPPTCTDADIDGYAVEGGDCGPADCDDANPNVNPGAAEVCDNGIDDDCDGLVDGGDADCAVCTDSDGDGYAVEGGVCGLVDCDDTDAAVNPGAAEVCDNVIDDDCDGLVDGDDPDCLTGPTCTDSDGGLAYDIPGDVSGLGSAGWPYTFYDVCDTGLYEGYLLERYCNGTTPWVRRYACPFGCANGACLTWADACTDQDGDTYAVEGAACGPVDCDDANPAVHPCAVEICDNGIDDNCDGLIDGDDLECAVCTDADGDGYALEGGVCGPADCDDSNPAIHPGARVDCDNGIDDDCDGLADAADPYCGSSDMNVILVGWDGTQRDHFWQCYNKQLPECANGLPHIEALSGGVIWNNTTTNGETATKAGWAQIVTGYNAEVTGVLDNWHYQPVPEEYTIFEKVENHYGPANVVTMFISGKREHTGGACIGDPTYKNGLPVLEDLGQPYCLTKTKVDYFELNQVWNAQIGNRALSLLETHQNDRFLALFLWPQPDQNGHVWGEDSVEYSNQIIELDGWLGQVVAKLRDLGIYKQTLVYVVSDHGFDEGKTMHLRAPYVMLATNDPLVIRGGDRKDIGPTVLDRFGITLGAIGAAPAVDGHSLYALPDLACIPEGQAYVDYPGAPECCAGLTWIPMALRFGTACVPPTGGAGDNTGYCTLCGNGVCTEPENRCNCPADCIY